VVSSTPRPHFTPGKDPVPILQEAGWAPGPVWTGGKSRPHRDSIPDRPVRSSVVIPTELPGPLLCLLVWIKCTGRPIICLCRCRRDGGGTTPTSSQAGLRKRWVIRKKPLAALPRITRSDKAGWSPVPGGWHDNVYRFAITKERYLQN